MNTTQSLQQMKDLKLMGMATSYSTQLELPVHHQLEGHELIAHLLEAEKLHRSDDRMKTLIKAAKLRFQVIPETIECSPQRNLSTNQWSTLLEGTYLTNGENILIVGATGCGKSFIACALGYQACLMGMKVRYFNMNRLIEALQMAKTEGSYLKFLNQLEKTSLIILDDFGLQHLQKMTKLALLQIIEDRYAKKSIIITSQLPIATWHEYLEEPTLADAICDRLTAKSHRIELKGESRRRKK